jgi:protein phosphatase
MTIDRVLDIAVMSDPGMVRANNEDAVLVKAACGLVILADGMGGYNAGEVASGMATVLLGKELEKAFAICSPDTRDANGKSWAHAALETEVARVNAAIHQAAQNQPQYAGMGTTLVAGVFHGGQLTIAHVGDSRVYRLRGDAFEQITRDHSLLQEQIDSGLLTPEEARYAQHKNLVTRALGVDPRVAVEIHDHAVQAGDVYLLCSDGLNDMVDDAEIGMTIGMLSANLALCATQLIQMANDNGGRDNVSVILVKVKEEFPVARGWWRRFLDRFTR